MIDLHTHSHFSDGSLSPTQLVQKAREVGLNAIALTDHDTLAGMEEFINACRQFELEGVPGVEFSVWEKDETGAQLHILGLELEFHQRGHLISDFTTMMQQKRLERTWAILEKLDELGMPLDESDRAALREVHMPGRAHIARLMIKKGYVHSVQEAFERWIGVGKPAFAPKPVFDPAYVIDLIHRMGGVAILAHPIYLKTGSYAELSRVIIDLKGKGLDGVEVLYPFTPREMVHRLMDLCDEMDLIVTGGSDFHGPEVKPNIFLGTGTGNLYIPFILLEKLRSRKKSLIRQHQS